MPRVPPATGPCRAEARPAPPMGTDPFHVERGGTAFPRRATGPWLPNHCMPHLGKAEPSTVKLRDSCLIRHAVRMKRWGLHAAGCFRADAVQGTQPIAARAHGARGGTRRTWMHGMRCFQEATATCGGVVRRSEGADAAFDLGLFASATTGPSRERTAHAHGQSLPESDGGPQSARSALRTSHGGKAAGRRCVVAEARFTRDRSMRFEPESGASRQGTP